MKVLKNIKTKKDFLFYIWELPQNFLGLMLINTTKAWYSVAWKDCYFTRKIKGVYSLGRYIILSDEFYNSVSVIKRARSFQSLSRKYGWLYLFVLFIKKMEADNA